MKLGEKFAYLLIVLQVVSIVYVDAEDAPRPADVWNYMYNFFSSLSSQQIDAADRGIQSPLLLPKPKADKPIITKFRRIRTPEDLKELDDQIEILIVKQNEEELTSNNSSSPWWHIWKWNVWKTFKRKKTSNCSNLTGNLPPALQAKLEKDPRLDPNTFYMVPVKETKSNCSWGEYIASFFSNSSSGQYIVNNGTLFNPPENVPAPFKIVKKYAERSDKAAKPSPITLEPFRFTTLIGYFKSGKKKGDDESEGSYYKKATKFLYDYYWGN